jgi:menaquinone-dependent protoporphyrinogen IX oxidase
MKSRIVCVSISNGNTRRVADRIAEVLHAQVVEPEAVDLAALGEYDLVGFGSGIYFNAAHPRLWRLVRRLPRHVTEGARELFSKTTSFRSRAPHAMAYAALGAAAALADDPDQPHAAELLRDAATMIAQASGHRHWPETSLRYANALLPECLLAAGAMLNDTRFERTRLRLLEWLVAQETAPEGHFSFTPTQGWTGGEPRPAFTVTGEADWADVTIRSAEWFIGRNDLGVAMFDDRTGGSFDGLQADGPNVNQGAESTIAFLTALRRAHEVALPRAQASVA